MSISALNIVALAAFAMPLVSVEKQKIDSRVDPVPMVESFTYEAKDGLLLRNGKPFYWIADGDDIGGVGATPLGLWLAKLQGTTLVSVQHSACVVDAEERDGGIRVTARLEESSFSWMREAIRLGFLTQGPEGCFHPEHEQGLSSVMLKYPEFRDSVYDHGHHMGADPGSELGLKVLDAKRHPLFSYGEKTGFFLPELNREPGPDPYNNRVKKGFREWARAKYGTLDEANATWRTSFAAWDDVVMEHTIGENIPDDSCLSGKSYRNNMKAFFKRRNIRARARKRERNDRPELYWDWMLYVQQDTTDSLRREFAAARKQAPHTLIGSDVRGHQSSRDNYVSYDPVKVDELADVFYVHSSGFKCYDYMGRPHDAKTLHDAICWPLFTCRYFRCNTTKPILNSEDIVRDVIVAAPSAKAMEENDIAQFSKVKFTAKPGSGGGGSLICKFEVPRRFEADRADGSRRFYLAGRSPGGFTAVVNGTKAGAVGTAHQDYKFDVTESLDFGGENELRLWFNEWCELPENPGCHLLAQDMFGESGTYGEKQYKSQYWSYMMGGHCADIVWHWNTNERLRLYHAALAKRLAAAAEIALPAVRFKKERVAFLYGYMAGVGLPASTMHLHHELMDWAGALEFSGHRFDVLGEEMFRARASQYPVIVAPDIWCVYDETVEAAKKYVRGGGTLVVTEGSLGKTFTRYRDSGFADFMKGDTDRGKVVVVEKGLGMESLAKRLEPLMPPPELKVEIAKSDEFPCMERLLAGDAKRKVLYLQNWGGLDQSCRVTLPAECRKWKMTPLEGAFRRTADGVDVKVEGSHGVAACILSAPGAAVPGYELSAREKNRIECVRGIMQFGRRTPGRKRVLFALDEKSTGAMSGVEIFPTLVAVTKAFKADVDAVFPWKWTEEMLSKYDAVVITEGNSCGYWMKVFHDKGFQRMIASYVENGGSLFAEFYSDRTDKQAALFWNVMLPAWRVTIPVEETVARDEKSYGFGDPRQILTKNVLPHPITDGVKSVQLFALMPLTYKYKCQMQTLVALPETSSHPNAPVMGAQESGKGRVVLMADPMAFQPYRIREADNAALLMNVFGWLLREDVTPTMREKFRKWCGVLE